MNMHFGEMSTIFPHQTHQLVEEIVPQALIYTSKWRKCLKAILLMDTEFFKLCILSVISGQFWPQLEVVGLTHSWVNNKGLHFKRYSKNTMGIQVAVKTLV